MLYSLYSWLHDDQDRMRWSVPLGFFLAIISWFLLNSWFNPDWLKSHANVLTVEIAVIAGFAMLIMTILDRLFTKWGWLHIFDSVIVTWLTMAVVSLALALFTQSPIAGAINGCLIYGLIVWHQRLILWVGNRPLVMNTFAVCIVAALLTRLILPNWF